MIKTENGSLVHNLLILRKLNMYEWVCVGFVWAIPGFLILVIFEILYGHITKKQSYVFMDTLASLSSGITNILKDILGLAVIIISYPYILEKLQFLKPKKSFNLFHCFYLYWSASYFVHLINHKVNFFGTNILSITAVRNLT